MLTGDRDINKSSHDSFALPLGCRTIAAKAQQVCPKAAENSTVTGEDCLVAEEILSAAFLPPEVLTLSSAIILLRGVWSWVLSSFHMIAA